jgi:hypothetical protein
VNVRAGAALAAAVLVGGCGGASVGRIGAATPVPETRDEILVTTGQAVWRRDLVPATAALARLAERETGVADPALDYWSDLLALLRCEPLYRIPRAEREARLDNPWDALRRLVQIERVRLARLERQDNSAARGSSGKASPRTLAPAARGVQQVSWPVEEEHWSDELPLPETESRCLAIGPTAAPARWSVPTDREAALVASAARALPADHPATAPLLVQAAVLAVVRGQAADARALLARLDAVSSALSPDDREQAAVAAAIVTLSDPSARPDALVARTKTALATGAPAQTRRALMLVLSERLAAAQRADDAVAARGDPPHGDDRVGRYLAFKQTEAHARAGRRAPLLAEAREALHRHGRAEVDDDPALAAIMDMGLRALLASPVSPETLEVLESLGPPPERLERAERFAQLALQSGAHQSAMSTFLWLYDTDTDPARQLQHLARASVAAARAGNRAEFARTFHLLAGQERDDGADAKNDATAAKQPGGKRPAADATAKPRDGALIAAAENEAVRERRRATRSANWQRALLVVARDALTALVESDDQPNLATLVETLKRHLGDGGRGPVDEELTTLYRAASAHLKTGARAYAETVGAPRRPILLGDVLVARSYVVPTPTIDLTPAVHELAPLVFVPRRGNDPAPASLQRWAAPLGVALAAPGGRS